MLMRALLRTLATPATELELDGSIDVWASVRGGSFPPPPRLRSRARPEVSRDLVVANRCKRARERAANNNNSVVALLPRHRESPF